MKKARIGLTFFGSIKVIFQELIQFCIYLNSINYLPNFSKFAYQTFLLKETCLMISQHQDEI